MAARVAKTEYQEIHRLAREENKKVDELAAQYNCTGQTIRNILKRVDGETGNAPAASTRRRAAANEESTSASAAA